MSNGNGINEVTYQVREEAENMLNDTNSRQFKLDKTLALVSLIPSDLF